ncbi:hypothetical protein WR25_04877 isoform C [Diploscapter pachys]|uniref:Uncharacterized protein n=1 Tax=Diploscapter pachys TaxID=2018661 RepID=A0A2A2L1I7_9BILA|nr:hypothetical protein WR25_04877 isoform C [Diploscapter pachys]
MSFLDINIAIIFSDLLKDGEKLVKISRNVEMIKDISQECDQTTTVTKNEVSEEKTIKEAIESDFRKFSIDLVNKLLLAKGPMVQTLVDSEVSKYAEFKLVDQLLCLSTNGAACGSGICPATSDDDPQTSKFIRVPCSKGEIFQSNVLSLIEKRKLIKFMNFCMQWNQLPDAVAEEWKDFSDKPFEEFLKAKDIDGNLLNYIVNAIGILKPNATTEVGLKAVCEFVDSVGQFGNSPFLHPLYGCGELPQCFCRLAAVYGAVYCLGMPIDAFVEENGKIVAVLTNGLKQRIDCRYVLMNPAYLPEGYCSYSNPSKEIWIDRTVHITNKPILEGDKEKITILNLAPLNSLAAPRLFEAGFQMCLAPKGYCMYY